ncbi:MAG: hypothetical protein LAN63_12160 [Acidobacteriia bacterium]|nr:hypothetical protein [Terriglobia bacterium]
MPNALKFLPGGRNTIALIAGFLLMFAVWWWWSSTSKTAPAAGTFSPPGELDRIEYAVQNARAWRVTTLGTMHGQPFQTDQDVVCPFDSHTVTHTPPASGNAAVLEEFVETKDMFYAREGTDPWASQPQAATDKCRGGPMAGPASLVATLDSLKLSARLRKGNLLQFQGGACRLWEVAAPSGPLGTMCVDEATHLPYELRFGALRVQYSNWNLPAAIEPPAMPSTIRGMVPTQPK